MGTETSRYRLFHGQRLALSRVAGYYPSLLGFVAQLLMMSNPDGTRSCHRMQPKQGSYWGSVRWSLRLESGLRSG